MPTDFPRMTITAEGITFHRTGEEDTFVPQEQIEVGVRGTAAPHYFINNGGIHRNEPRVRLNRDAEATFTATNTTINEELLRQLVGDFEARIPVPEYQPRMFERQDLNNIERDFERWRMQQTRQWVRTNPETLDWLNIDDEFGQPEKELADVDPDEFDKILSA